MTAVAELCGRRWPRWGRVEGHKGYVGDGRPGRLGDSMSTHRCDEPADHPAPCRCRCGATTRKETADA